MDCARRPKCKDLATQIDCVKYASAGCAWDGSVCAVGARPWTAKDLSCAVFDNDQVWQHPMHSSLVAI